MNYDLYCDVLVGEMDDVMFPVWSAQSEECISLSKKVLLMRVAHDLEDINRLTNDMFERELNMAIHLPLRALPIILLKRLIAMRITIHILKLAMMISMVHALRY